MFEVSLEVPLTQFMFGRFLQSDNARSSRIQVFGESFDRATLACCIPTFEKRNDSLPGLLYPVLYFEQLNLKLFLVLFINGVSYSRLVWVGTISKKFPDLLRVVPQLTEDVRWMIAGGTAFSVFFRHTTNLFNLPGAADHNRVIPLSALSQVQAVDINTHYPKILVVDPQL
jgi:hypothetical protein